MQRLRRRVGRRACSYRRPAVGVGAGLHARRPRRVPEPRGVLDRRQPRRSDLQCARAPLCEADALRGGGASEPADLPNYLALVSGSTQGLSSDCWNCIVHARNLADTLAAAGKTWKTYAGDLPYPGFTGGSAGRYAKKHDPFLYFRDVVGSRARRDRVVPYTQLARDLAAHRLPDFSLVIPNLCHDMHDCSVATGDAWLRAHVVPLLRSPQLRGGVVFVVFDEGSSDTGGVGARIEALALGPTVRRGSRFARATNHYGLLRTIEDAWRLPRLGHSRSGTPIGGIWR